jgi:hypothetical protein
MRAVQRWPPPDDLRANVRSVWKEAHADEPLVRALSVQFAAHDLVTDDTTHLRARLRSEGIVAKMLLRQASQTGRLPPFPRTSSSAAGKIRRDMRRRPIL